MLDGMDSPLRHDLYEKYLYEKYLLGRGTQLKVSCVIAAKWQPQITEILKAKSASITDNDLLNCLISKYGIQVRVV